MSGVVFFQPSNGDNVSISIVMSVRLARVNRGPNGTPRPGSRAYRVSFMESTFDQSLYFMLETTAYASSHSLFMIISVTAGSFYA